MGEVYAFPSGAKEDSPQHHDDPKSHKEEHMADNHGHDHGKKGGGHGHGGGHGEGKGGGMGNPKNIFLLILVGIFAMWVATYLLPSLLSAGITNFSVVGCKLQGGKDCVPPAATNGNENGYADASAGAHNRRLIRRERYAASPRLRPARKQLVNGPRERGPADEYCFSRYPHWRQLMAERDDCDMTAGHGSGGTDCHIVCGKR